MSPTKRGADAVRAIAAEMESDLSIDAFASRDMDPSEAVEPLRYRAPDLAALIAECARLPWVSLRVGSVLGIAHHALAEYARGRAGQAIVVVGPSGSGKSSLAIDTARHHARHVGPVVYVSLELSADEVGSRMTGMELGMGWEDVTRGAVSLDRMSAALADFARMVVLAGPDATLTKAESTVVQLRAESPDLPILVAIDYLQLLEGEGREERIRVASIAEAIRRFAQRLGVVVLAVSQTSRASSRGLRDGELVGADTTSTGAETAQIERMAALTIALGSMRPQEDGTTAIDISIGKGRMGQGDRVIPAVYNGRVGTWHIAGPSVSGAERRAERTGDRDGARVHGAGLAVKGCLAAASAPMSRADLVSALGLRRADVVAAVKALLADPAADVVQVRGKRTGPAWPVWTRTRAEATGLDIVPGAVGEAP